MTVGDRCFDPDPTEQGSQSTGPFDLLPDDADAFVEECELDDNTPLIEELAHVFDSAAASKERRLKLASMLRAVADRLEQRVAEGEGDG